MTPSWSENARWYALVIGLAGVLGLLAVLQYRSTKAVSEATTNQMVASLQGSLMAVRQGFEAELGTLCREMQSESTSATADPKQEYPVRLERWRGIAAHPDLVADVFLWQGGPQPTLWKLNASRNALESADWPAPLNQLRDRLSSIPPEFGGPPDMRRPDEPLSKEDGRVSPSREAAGAQALQPNFGNPDSRRNSSRPQGFPPRHHHPGDADDHFFWMIDQSIPALMHVSRFNDGPRDDEPHQNRRPEPAPTSVIIVLDRDVLEKHVFPEIIQRYFGSKAESAYEVAITSSESQPELLYTTDTGFGGAANSFPDATLNLFGPPQPAAANKELAPFIPARFQTPTGKTDANGVRVHREDWLFISPIRYSREAQNWEVIAKHRKGSVESAVAQLYLRNLIFNFAVVLVLAATMGMIIVASQRARRFGQLQMDFVTSVSHELRTPLAGIVAAGQNIADGVVADKEKVARYGTAIVAQAQQLANLVEQILLFSATQKDRHRYHLQAVDVANAIDASLKSTASLIRKSAITVEQHVPLNLPHAMADIKALSQCLQNLIANAVKYSGDGNWIGVQASTAYSASGVGEIRILVRDRGIGISREDMAHIFEPFYRSPQVTAAQIHGSGLGLPLTKSMIEAMGGRLTVESEPGKGSKFTLHVPIHEISETITAPVASAI